MSFVDDLIARTIDIERKLDALDRKDVLGRGSLPVYSGTPTAGAIAYWTGAGTIAGGGAVTYSSGNLAIAGTATSGYALSVTRNLTAASTDSPVVSILQDHASDDQPALYVRQDGDTATAFVVEHNMAAGGVAATYPLQRWAFATLPTSYFLKLDAILSASLVRYSFSLVNASTTYADMLMFDRGNISISGTGTTGSPFSVTRNLTATSTDSPVVSILQDHASDDQVALEVLQDGTGAGVTVRGPNAKSSATASTPLYLRSSDALASGLAMSIEINGNATAGSRYTSIHSIEQGTSFRPLVLNPSADVMAVILRAFSASGLTITDDGGNLGIFIEDGGRVGIGTTTPAASPETLSRLTVEGSDGTGIYAVIRNTGNGQAALSLTRTGTTPSRWVIYIPGANDLLSFYSGTLADAPLNLLSTGQMVAGSLTSVGATRLGIKAGTSTNDAAAGGVLYLDSGSFANGTTVETTLATYSLPANSLSANNMSIAVSAWGTITNAAATKTLKFYFGATVVTLISGGSGIPATWTMHARVIRTGAATQDILVEAVGTGLTPVTITTAAETLSGAITVKMTGQGGASSQVLQEGYVVEWLDQNT